MLKSIFLRRCSDLISKLWKEGTPGQDTNLSFELKSIIECGRRGRIEMVVSKKSISDQHHSRTDSWVFLVALLLFISACSTGPTQYGILEGHVTIGPLLPVHREGDPIPTPSSDVYAAREIVVYKENGQTEVVRLKIDSDGNFHSSLPVGTYVVDINHVGIDMAKGFPKTIEIKYQQVTRVDIDIDTGIR
jgi:hypothetical protein